MLCIAHRIQWYSNGQKLSDRQMVWYKDTKKWRSPEVILMHYLPTGVYSEYTVIHNHHYSCVYLLGITRPTTTRERIENRLYMSRKGPFRMLDFVEDYFGGEILH